MERDFFSDPMLMDASEDPRNKNSIADVSATILSHLLI